tara:strand:- start:77 stop:283 length:207 start_codon:yes stop_codon:yes gene_type:complete
MAKTKKPNKSGYSFRGLFAGRTDESEWVKRLKVIANEEMRSVTMQASVLLMQGIEEYENRKRYKQNKR